MPHPIERITRVFSLSPEDQQTIVELMEERTFRRGETISGRQLHNNAFYVVCGMARVYYLENGREHTYSFAMEDEFVVLSRALIDAPDESFTSIEFLEPTTVLCLPRRIYSTMEEIIPDLRDKVLPFIMTAMTDYIRYLEERLAMMQNTSARSRYRWLLKCYPRLLERVPMTQIASYLGLTKETLYRIRSGKYTGK
ncbi:MAG: Crp/Fnr family transcriptional regulator [Clostridium sp.]|nr:Crp/Fnr family transcriptional regulator [Clostridium sp.]